MPARSTPTLCTVSPRRSHSAKVAPELPHLPLGTWGPHSSLASHIQNKPSAMPQHIELKYCIQTKGKPAASALQQLYSRRSFHVPHPSCPTCFHSCTKHNLLNLEDPWEQPYSTVIATCTSHCTRELAEFTKVGMVMQWKGSNHPGWSDSTLYFKIFHSASHGAYVTWTYHSPQGYAAARGGENLWQ